MAQNPVISAQFLGPMLLPAVFSLLTLYQGVSGAGKTTLLDVISQRVTEGSVTGKMLVNGSPLEANFQRNTGYVQQQDIHIETTTVREALRFSAILRQPRSTSKEEKFAAVERVIEMLGMSEFAEAIVGVPGQGLNTEQRKLLTIGVELAANPSVLLFLDEPTTGLDSQSAWGVIDFIRKLANQGTTLLCTIHQPSSALFNQFDRLLLLAEGGKTVYFGDVGINSQTMIQYFERHGARICGVDENPAEYMLEVVSDKSSHDWTKIWKVSSECQATLAEMKGMRDRMDQSTTKIKTEDDNREFALPLWEQMYHVTQRTFQQYWRTPKYVIAKMMLGFSSSL
jgi:ATP-binding cassette subfamily G (WHITE) protein 2 (PDR)